MQELFYDYDPAHLPEEPAVNFKRLNYSEPAVLRGIVAALVALAAALGFSVSTEINGAAEVLIPVIAFVLPLAQSLWTRAAVFAPKSVDVLVGKHAAPEA